MTIPTPGGPDALVWGEIPDVTAGPGEVVVEIAASAVNRGDLLQRQGHYPPPPGASDVPGLECSGVVAAVGPGVAGWSVGDEVCCLLAGGGYAEKVAVPAEQLMPVPAGVDLVTAAALPEVACTVWSNVVMTAHLAAGESFLVHGGASGIGTMALQVAAAIGAAPVMCTAGSADKLARCRDLGADRAINYHDEDFVAVAKDATGGRGADVVLDIIGARYLERNVDVLAPDGRLVVIGMQGGTTASLDLGALLRKRGTVAATALRSRPLAQKADICADVVARLWPLVASGQVRPVVHAAVPLESAADAHRMLEAGDHIGKILLTVDR